MKFFNLMAIMITFALPVKADSLSSCHSQCYGVKQSCNARKSHTFNSCDDHLFACKASCNSGKPQAAYGAHSMEVSFRPVLDFDK